MKKFTFMCCFVIAAAFVQGQVTLHVPSEYNTIQAGINAANPGDIVLVSDGIYYEQINFLGKKPLTVASEFLTDGDDNHITNTIIDGSLIPDGDSCSVVYFISGEDTTSILCGFTIQHGKGTHVIGTYSIWSGGGIFIANAGAKIAHNHITENHLSDTTMGINTQLSIGGGMVVYGSDEVYNWIIIDHNVIDQNSLHSENLQSVGAGFWIEKTNAIITNNQISSNTSTASNSSAALAGGFGAYGPTARNMSVLVQSNILKDNLTQSEYGGWATTACGYIENVALIFIDNLVSNNESNQVSGSIPGGIVGFYNPGPGSHIQNNIFDGNKTSTNGGGLCVQLNQIEPDHETVLIENNYFISNEARHGGGLMINNCPVFLQNNVFSGNTASFFGGGIYMKGTHSMSISHSAVLMNNSFLENKADLRGGAIYTTGINPLITNTIFWNDSSDVSFGPEIHVNAPDDTLEIANSDIDFNSIQGRFIDGGFNINEDPLFDDPDLLTLQMESPCIGSGTATFTCECGEIHFAPGYDIIGTHRPQSGAFEMGAYEYIFVGTPEMNSHQSSVITYPNPFSSNTVIEYQLESEGAVFLVIYNHIGQQVDVLVNEMQTKGKHQVIWNAERLPAGVYFYRLTTNDQRLTSGKLVVLR